MGSAITWESWVILAVLANWVGLYLGSAFYVAVLWLVTGDIRYEGQVRWAGFFPVYRFRLISRKSWFARAWENWYGHGLFGFMIHRDEPGSYDDTHVEKTIIHELRHHGQQFVLGALFYIAYGIHYRVQSARGLDGYHLNWFEVDAREAADSWDARGRPGASKLGRRQ